MGFATAIARKTASLLGSVAAIDDNLLLLEWAASGAYQVTSVTRDSDRVAETAVVVWPDGSAGVLTRLTKNTEWLAADSYSITHADSGLTVTQGAVSRDAFGAVSSKPALSVA